MSYLDILNETRQNMATANPFENIMLGAQGFNQIQNQLLQNQQAQQTLDQNAAMNPLLMQSRQAQLQGQQVQNQAAQMEIDDFQKKERLGQLYRASQALKPFIEKGDLQGASTVAAKLTDFGLPEETAAEVQRLVQIGDSGTIMGHINTIESLAAQDLAQGDTADIETFKYLNRIIAPAVVNGVFDESKATPEQLAAAKQLGLVAKAGTMTQGEREAYNPYLAETITKNEAIRAGATSDAKARAELMAEYDLRPSIQRRVEQAVSQARAQTARTEEKRSNERAFKVYDSALSGLFTSLGETATGPIVGMMPALTANQQTADGAVALMAPVMKEIFRSAGEGSFTEGDQKLLMRMLPDRTTEPEARIKQLATVDAIVRSKLGKDVKVVSTVLGREVSMKDVFDEAVRSKMSVEEVKQELGIE